MEEWENMIKRGRKENNIIARRDKAEVKRYNDTKPPADSCACLLFGKIYKTFFSSYNRICIEAWMYYLGAFIFIALVTSRFVVGRW